MANYLEWSDDQIDGALNSINLAIKARKWPEEHLVPAAFFDVDNHPAFWCLDTEDGAESFVSPEAAITWIESQGIHLPCVARIVSVLNKIRNQCDQIPAQGDDEYGADDLTIDVRLQLHSDSYWAVRSGDSQYDQDHRGFWGSSCVGSDDSDDGLEDIARDLIDQCADSAAQAGHKVIEAE